MKEDNLNTSIADILLAKSGGKITADLISKIRIADSALADSLQLKLEEQGESKTTRILKQFITSAPLMIKLKEHVVKLALVNDPVLIIGESGTGKELLAKALHGDREGSFIAINCSGMPIELLESELFGHKKGAFTGANNDKVGLLEEAENGTVFLDEIGDMPLLMQSKLLRTIQEMTIRRVGSNGEIKINCRFIAATHKNLELMVNHGTFRNDLFHRLNTFFLRPSPIRERVADIPLIIESLDDSEQIKDIEEFCSNIDKSLLTGNVRSLQQLVRRYVVLKLLPGELL